MGSDTAYGVEPRDGVTLFLRRSKKGYTGNISSDHVLSLLEDTEKTVRLTDWRWPSGECPSVSLKDDIEEYFKKEILSRQATTDNGSADTTFELRTRSYNQERFSYTLKITLPDDAVWRYEEFSYDFKLKSKIYLDEDETVRDRLESYGIPIEES